MKEFIAEKQRNKGRSVIPSAYHDKENVTGVMIFLYMLILIFLQPC